jgi:PAS domain S-box-containing protein
MKQLNKRSLIQKISLGDSEERFQKVFEYSNDAIFVIDPENDKIVDANSKACRILGYSKDELLEISLSKIHPHELPALQAFAQSVLDTGNGWTNELSCMTKSGGFVPSEISASVLKTKEKTYLIALIRDITKRKEAEKALQNLNVQLEKLVEERTTELAKVNESLNKALEEVECLKNRLQAENIYLQEEIKLEHNFEEIITSNEKFKKILRKVEQVASTNAIVLILGETGTGKELIARAIHNISLRRERPLVKVNCAALPANLVESELFGHEKGAFTGALAKKVGRFELADNGTIFLDEIGDLPFELQAKLLRVLQEGEFERLGSSVVKKVDVRIIAATNRNLAEAITEGDFREDLYYRLNVFPIKLLPLRERKDDIPLLLKHFVQKQGRKIGKIVDRIPSKMIDLLSDYSWPGNVRELENVIERAIIISPGHTLELGDWFTKQPRKVISKETLTLEEMEREHILSVLKSTGWRVSGNRGAAKILGIKSPTLVSKIKKLGIERNKSNL